MNIPKIILFLATLLVLACKLNPKTPPEETRSHADVICKQSLVFEYKGIKSTEELTQLLDTSSKPFIKSLSDSTKLSIIKYLQFENGIPEKFSGTDVNIKNLYTSNAHDILKEIIGTEVIMCSLITKPKVKMITLEEYTAMSEKTPMISYLSSWCTDCTKGTVDPCCNVPGDGCRDNIIKIEEEYFSVN